MRPMTEAGAKGGAAESHVGEHLEAVVSGRLRQAFLLTLLILVVELGGGIWYVAYQCRQNSNTDMP
jgi:hypothetical protein